MNVKSATRSTSKTPAPGTTPAAGRIATAGLRSVIGGAGAIRAGLSTQHPRDRILGSRLHSHGRPEPAVNPAEITLRPRTHPSLPGRPYHLSFHRNDRGIVALFACWLRLTWRT